LDDQGTIHTGLAFAGTASSWGRLRGFFNQWVSAIYTWTFWDYLSRVGAGVDPDYTVEQAALLTAYTIQLDWMGYPWALPLEYCLAIIELSEPALGAKLRDHL